MFLKIFSLDHQYQNRQEVFLIILRMIQRLQMSFPPEMKKPALEEDVSIIIRKPIEYYVNLTLIVD